MEPTTPPQQPPLKASLAELVARESQQLSDFLGLYLISGEHQPGQRQTGPDDQPTPTIGATEITHVPPRRR
jgi:hypothetical protein